MFTSRLRATEYIVTIRRVYSKYGLVSRKTVEAKLEWITYVIVKQGFFARLFNVGDVILATPSGPIMSVVFKGVSDPMYVRSLVLHWTEKIKEAQRIKEKLRRLEEEYEFGKIPEHKYIELRENYEKELSEIESRDEMP